VLSVIAYHLNHAWLPGGFLGVDVFFVISGFVVSASVSSLKAKHVLGRMVAFYARRFIRIMPALLVMLLITTVVTALIIPPAWLSLNIERTGILAFFGVSNFFLRNTSNDYFSLHSTFNPYTHTWSLGVEEQFYFVFPVLFLATNLVKRLERFAPLIFIGGFLVSVAYALTRGVSDPVNAFYMITSRFWELAAGVLLFQFLSARKWVPGRKLKGPTWLFRWGSAAMLAFLALSLIYPHFGPVPAPGSFLAVVATVGLLGLCLGLPPTSGVRRFLELPVMQRIGKLSYSLYLWHWPVFVFFRWTIGLQSVLQILSALLITTFLASLSYWAVEHRLRRSERVKRAPRLLVVGIALVSVVASATLATVINRHTGDLTLSTVARNSADWYPDASTTSSAFPRCAVTIKSRVLQVTPPLEYPVTIEALTRSGCTSPVTGPKAIVLGDSHAVAYEPILFDYVLRTGASVIFSAEPSCGFVSFTTTEVDPKCLAHRALLSSTILREVKAGDVLFLPSLRLPRFSDQDQAVATSVIRQEIFGPDGVVARKAGATFGADFVVKAEAKGARIVFEGVPPILRTPNFRCTDWYDKTNPVCRGGATLNRQLLEELRAPMMREIEKLTSNSTAGSIWDPFPILCPPAETQCPAYNDNKPLYFDGDHLSGYANQVLRQSLEAALVNAGKTP
jgi:peptidoglycan/LPS O-acetylase OafA/YrhL